MPSARKTALAMLCDELGKEARNLHTAALKKDEKETTAVLTRINYQVRALRPDE